MQLWFFVILGIAVLGIGYLTICYTFANQTLYPKRQPLVRFPDEYGIVYEDVEFKSTDGLSLKGWFIPGKRNKVVIVTHPMFCNRHGLMARYQSRLTSVKSGIDLLVSIKALNDAGYSIFTFDFRNHGESKKGVTGVGLNEYQDVLGALDYLENRGDIDSSDIGLVGFCMGANAMIVAISKAKARFTKAKCLIAIQPVTMLVFTRSYIKNLYTPFGLILLPMIDRIRQWRGGYSLKEMSPQEFVKDVTVPTLYVQARTDPWTELTDIQCFYEETAGPKVFWWLEEQMSRIDAYNYVGQHPQKMTAFLQCHF
jgi:uncharacterized protein